MSGKASCTSALVLQPLLHVLPRPFDLHQYANSANDRYAQGTTSFLEKTFSFFQTRRVLGTAARKPATRLLIFFLVHMPQVGGFPSPSSAALSSSQTSWR